MTLDLAQPTAAAGAGRRVWSQALFDARNVLRNGENLLLTIVIPVGVLVLLLTTGLGGERTPGQALVAAVSLAVLATAFTSQAIATGFDRRYGVLRMLGLSPLGARGLLAARTLVSLMVVTLQVLILVALAAAISGWFPTDPLAVVQAILVILLGVWAYTAWALLIAGALRAEATLAVANAIFLLLMFGGGLAIPLDSLPWQPVAQYLPTGAMVLALQSAPFAWAPLLVLVLWGVVGTATATRLFRWES